MTVQTEREALLPCPFCGNPPRQWVTARIYIGCDICAYSIHGFPAEKVEASWNRRSQPSALALPVEAIKAGMLALIEDNMLLRQSISDSDYGDTTALEALFTERQADIDSLRTLLSTQGDKA